MMHAKVHAISKSKFLGACNFKEGRGMRTIEEWQQQLLGACTGKRDRIPMKQFFFFFFIDQIEPFHEAIHTLFHAQTSTYRSFHTSSGKTLVHEQNLYWILIYDLAYHGKNLMSSIFNSTHIKKERNVNSIIVNSTILVP